MKCILEMRFFFSISYCLVIYLCYLPLKNFAQTIPDSNEIEFVVKKIKSTYPGYVLSGSRWDKYCESKINREKNIKDTFKFISELLFFFEDKHLSLREYDVYQRFDSAESIKNYHSIQKYLASSKETRNIEGYWVDDKNTCVIGVKLADRSKKLYEGFIVESKNGLPLGGKLFTMYKKKGKNRYLTDFVFPDEDTRAILISKFNGDTILTNSSLYRWSKLKNYAPSFLQSTKDFSYNLSFSIIDSNNIYVRIPVNSRNNGRILDSIIRSNLNVFKKTKNLIIDIRDNYGGTVSTYTSLIPFVCTNSIQKISADLLCSADFIKEQETYINEKSKKADTTNLEAEKRSLEKYKSNLGKVILYEGKSIGCDSMYAYPKNVAIIINYGTLSAAEIMILDFSQSKKVTIFGEATGGAIDYLDVLFIDAPFKTHFLTIPSTKRITSKVQPSYDKFGIPPNVKLKINGTNWLEEVIKYYETK